MEQTILELEPKRLWHYFNEICGLHRASGNEEQIRNYIVGFAERQKLEFKRDKAGNVVIRKKGVAGSKSINGGKGAKPLIFQCHMDMVCESHPDTNHNFESDPIRPKINGEWVTADNTTLGADNGIGVAACLALLESTDLKHGPIECLFTATEETGMDGAFGLEKDMLKGRTLINLDSEDEGLLFIGCSGGCDTVMDISVKHEPVPAGWVAVKVGITGLKGGHSGLMIHEQRGNALKLMGWMLYVIGQTNDIRVASINGGTKRNVIPSTAEAVIVIKQKEKGDILRKIRAFKEKIGHKLIKVDPDVEVTISGADAKECFDKETTSKITAFLHVVPHGVVTMSYEIEGLVQTSTNLAVVKTNGKVINVQFHSRSSSASGIETIKSRLCALGELMGIKVEEIGGYPGWQPNLDSKILSLMKSTHEEIFGKEARHAAVHAGLECGIIGEKFPGMDMVSFGPEIKGAHSIEERVQIKSVDNFWKVLVKTLENFAKS